MGVLGFGVVTVYRGIAFEDICEVTGFIGLIGLDYRG